MSNIILRTLVDKLSPISSKSLEEAAGFCLAQTHYQIEIEHWLIKLVTRPESELPVILRHFGIDSNELVNDLTAAMTGFKSGNSRSPSLSVQLADWLRAAWNYTSLEFAASRINPGHLLYALITDETLRHLIKASTRLLEKIPSAELQGLLPKISLNAHAAEHSQSSGQAGQNALTQFTTDLTQRAREGKIDPVPGRDNEIRKVMDILTRRRQNNPILVGEAGVGKTAVVEGLALRIAKGDVPPPLQKVSILVLDLALLQAGAGIKGEFENRLKSVIQEINASPHPVILFIDEAHTLIGAGGQPGQGDAANLLKPALARGELRTIAATTWSEYKRYIEKDAALSRRFHEVKIEEPEEDAAIGMLQSLQPSLEQHHQVRILQEAVKAAVSLSKRYLTGRKLPDKSVSLLDTACARVRLSQTATPFPIEDCELRLSQLQHQEDRLKQEQNRGLDHQKALSDIHQSRHEITLRLERLRKQWQAEKVIFTSLQDIVVELNKLDDTVKLKAEFNRLQQELRAVQARQPLIHAEVNAESVAEVIADWTGIPAGKMLQDEVNEMINLTQRLSDRVLGQPHAMQMIAERMQMARANLIDPEKPQGVFLLVGSSGIGKTETALALAETLYGGEQAITVINMAEFKEEYKISLLTGSPPGYVGYGEGGVLTEAVRRRPYGVILLDEMEKAHRNVQDIFYQLFDKGILMDGEGRLIDFRNSVIIMTSNACAGPIDKIVETKPDIGPDELNAEIHPELLKYFKPAFLGRLNVIPYKPLSAPYLQKIAEQKLAKIQRRITRHYGVELKIADTVIAGIAVRCNQPEIGARHIDHIVNKEILPLLAQNCLKRIAEGKQMQNLSLSLPKNGAWAVRMR